jgi:drug/metabolite transporter (DMT)-like permease
MYWQILSVLSCILFGFTGILISTASAGTQASRSVFLWYSSALFLSAVGFRYFGSDQQTGPMQRNEVLCAFGAGILGAVAIIIQVCCFGRFPGKAPWIILVCCMNPAVVIAYNVFFQGGVLTLKRVLAFILVVIAIFLLESPNSSNSTPNMRESSERQHE